MQQYLEAGKVVTTHGVRGEMKLELWCDGVDFLKKTGRLYASAKGGKCYNIISIRPQGQMALLQLEGVNDMDAARALRGQVFYFDRSDATLPEGRWYVADLIGCETPTPERGTASSPAWTTPAHRTSIRSSPPAARNICSPAWTPFSKSATRRKAISSSPPSRACWTTISTVSGRRSERWECVWTS